MSDRSSAQFPDTWAPPPRPRPLPKFLRPIEPQVPDDYPEPLLLDDLSEPHLLADRLKSHHGQLKPHRFPDVLHQFPDPPPWASRGIIVDKILHWIVPKDRGSPRSESFNIASSRGLPASSLLKTGALLHRLAIPCGDIQDIGFEKTPDGKPERRADSTLDRAGNDTGRIALQSITRCVADTLPSIRIIDTFVSLQISRLSKKENPFER